MRQQSPLFKTSPPFAVTASYSLGLESVCSSLIWTHPPSAVTKTALESPRLTAVTLSPATSTTSAVLPELSLLSTRSLTSSSISLNTSPTAYLNSLWSLGCLQSFFSKACFKQFETAASPCPSQIPSSWYSSVVMQSIWVRAQAYRIEVVAASADVGECRQVWGAVFKGGAGGGLGRRCPGLQGLRKGLGRAAEVQIQTQGLQLHFSKTSSQMICATQISWIYALLPRQNSKFIYKKKKISKSLPPPGALTWIYLEKLHFTNTFSIIFNRLGIYSGRRNLNWSYRNYTELLPQIELAKRATAAFGSIISWPSNDFDQNPEMKLLYLKFTLFYQGVMSQLQNARARKVHSHNHRTKSIYSAAVVKSTSKKKCDSQPKGVQLPDLKKRNTSIHQAQKETAVNIYRKCLRANKAPSQLENSGSMGVSKSCLRAMEAFFLQSKKRFKEAIAFYQSLQTAHILEASSQSWMLLYNKAQCLRNIGKHSQAKTVFKQTWERSGRTCGSALRVYLHLCIQIGSKAQLFDFRKIEPTYISLELIQMQELSVIFNQGLRAKKVGQFSEATKLFREITKQHEGNLGLKAQINIGIILQNQQKNKEALEHYKKLQLKHHSKDIENKIQKLAKIPDIKQRTPLKLIENKDIRKSRFSISKQAFPFQLEPLSISKAIFSNASQNNYLNAKIEDCSSSESDSKSSVESAKINLIQKNRSIMAKALHYQTNNNNRTSLGARKSVQSSTVNLPEFVVERKRSQHLRLSMNRLKDLTVKTSIQFGNCEFFQQGQHFYKIGKYDLAIESFVSALIGNDQETQVRIYWLLIDCFEKTNAIGQAIQACRSIEQIKGIQATAAKMCELYQKTNRLERFIRNMKKSLENETKKQPIIYEYIGWAYLKLDQHEEALDYLQAAATLDPQSLSIKLKLAHAYCLYPKFRNKLQNVLSFIVDRNNDPSQLTQMLIFLMLQINQPALIEERIVKLLEQKNTEPNSLADNPAFLFLLARICISKKQYPAAFEYLNQSLKINSKFHYSRFELASLYAIIGNHQLAIVSLEKCLDVEQFRQQALIRLGRIYEEKQNWIKAQHYYELASEDCRTGQCLRRIAVCANKRGDFKKSIHFYKQSLKFDRAHPDPFEKMADAKFKQGLYEKAERLYSLAYERQHRQDILLKKISCLVKLKRFSEAIQFSLQSCKPSSEQFENLGFCYYSTNEMDRAIEYFKKFDQIQSTYESNFNLGLCYHKLGQTFIAQEYYQTALTLKPDHCPSVFNLGQLYLSKQDTEKAIQYLQKFEDVKGEDPSRPTPGELKNGEYILIERSH